MGYSSPSGTTREVIEMMHAELKVPIMRVGGGGGDQRESLVGFDGCADRLAGASAVFGVRAVPFNTR